MPTANDIRRRADRFRPMPSAEELHRLRRSDRHFHYLKVTLEDCLKACETAQHKGSQTEWENASKYWNEWGVERVRQIATRALEEVERDDA